MRRVHDFFFFCNAGGNGVAPAGEVEFLFHKDCRQRAAPCRSCWGVLSSHDCLGETLELFCWIPIWLCNNCLVICVGASPIEIPSHAAAKGVCRMWFVYCVHFSGVWCYMCVCEVFCLFVSLLLVCARAAYDLCPTRRILTVSCACV